MSGGRGRGEGPLPPRARDPLSGAGRRAALWPWLSLLIASLGLAAAIVWQVRPGSLKLPTVRPRIPAAPSTPRPATTEQRRVRLFFPQESGETLMELERDIPYRPVLAEEVRSVLRELANGVPGGRSPVPPRAEVRQVFRDAFGIIYLDFGREFQTLIGAPGSQPELAIAAIVNSLTSSFSEIKRVQFLLEGKETREVVGGWDLRRPVSPRFPGQESPPVVSQPQE